MKRFFNPLFSAADSSGGGGGSSDPTPSPADNSPPPAAAAVLASDAKEEDAAEIVRLKRENEEAHGKLKKHETRISELEDENRRLKEPVKIPVVDAAKQKKGFLDGATFFG